MDTALVILVCSVFVILGLGHAALVLFTRKFEPRDSELLEKLKSGRTGMSRTANMWDGIRGFHLSHSLGMVLFGGLYISLALENNSFLKSSTPLNLALFVVPAIYIFLAHRYWFSVPRNCFIVAVGFLAASVAFR